MATGDNVNSGAALLAGLVNRVTVPVLWLTLFDACAAMYGLVGVDKHSPPSYGRLLEAHGLALLVIAALAGVLAYGVGRCCRGLIQPDGHVGNGDFAEDQRYLHGALSAGLVGMTLIVLEPVLGWYLGVDVGFNLEELLLGTSGINMLMEETKLTRQYHSMRLRHDAAKRESDKLIGQIGQFRGEIMNTVHNAFGGQKAVAEKHVSDVGTQDSAGRESSGSNATEPASATGDSPTAPAGPVPSGQHDRDGTGSNGTGGSEG